MIIVRICDEEDPQWDSFMLAPEGWDEARASGFVDETIRTVKTGETVEVTYPNLLNALQSAGYVPVTVVPTAEVF